MAVPLAHRRLDELSIRGVTARDGRRLHGDEAK
jgi:hypothetical protein